MIVTVCAACKHYSFCLTMITINYILTCVFAPGSPTHHLLNQVTYMRPFLSSSGCHFFFSSICLHSYIILTCYMLYLNGIFFPPFFTLKIYLFLFWRRYWSYIYQTFIAMSWIWCSEVKKYRRFLTNIAARVVPCSDRSKALLLDFDLREIGRI